MKAYEQGAGAYFATPPVNLIYAFNTSLTTITKSSEINLEERFKLHQEASQRVKSAAKELGLKQVSDPESAANGMTAVSSVFTRFLRCHRLTFARPALLPRWMHCFGYSPPALRKRSRCCRRVAQGYQGPVLPYRVRAMFSLPCNLPLIVFLILDIWEFPSFSSRGVTSIRSSTALGILWRRHEQASSKSQHVILYRCGEAVRGPP